MEHEIRFRVLLGALCLHRLAHGRSQWDVPVLVILKVEADSGLALDVKKAVFKVKIGELQDQLLARSQPRVAGYRNPLPAIIE